MVKLVFLASNSLHNLGGQKQLCLCYHERHLQQIHWIKHLCGMYSFTGKLSIARLNICQILMRLQHSRYVSTTAMPAWQLCQQGCIASTADMPAWLALQIYQHGSYTSSAALPEQQHCQHISIAMPAQQLCQHGSLAVFHNIWLTWRKWLTTTTTRRLKNDQKHGLMGCTCIACTSKNRSFADHLSTPICFSDIHVSIHFCHLIWMETLENQV